MPRYIITHACGHDAEHLIDGPGRERAYWIDKETERICLTCRKERRNAAHAQESARSAAANAALGLPSLLGTPKQIAWAETLRAKALEHLEAVDGTLREQHVPPGSEDRYLAVIRCIRSLRTRVRSETSAGVIIDRRADFESVNAVIRWINSHASNVKYKGPVRTEELPELLADPHAAIRELGIRAVGQVAPIQAT